MNTLLQFDTTNLCWELFPEIFQLYSRTNVFLTYISLRQKDISSGIQLENFWKELPTKISCVKL